MMNYEWRKALDAMRKEGYAVCVFTPDELKGVRADLIEGYLVSQGNEEIMLQHSYEKHRLELFGEDNDN